MSTFNMTLAEAIDISSVSSILIPILTALGGGIGVLLINIYRERHKYFIDRKQQDNSQIIALNDQAFKIYKGIVDDLQENLIQVHERFKDIDTQHIRCREENAKLQIEIQICKQENVVLKLDLDGLRAEFEKFKHNNIG